jgi:hypothetical protein
MRVPDAVGRYVVMLCDPGCSRPLGLDTVPARLTVVADPATAVLAERVQSLRSNAARMRMQLTRAYRARGGLAAQVEQLGTEIAGLRREAARPDRDGRSLPIVLAAGIAALLGIVVGAGLVLLRTSRAPIVAYASSRPFSAARSPRHSSLARSASSASRRRST